ncbi:SAM-dependent methyltransferase [Arthrobacter sp. CAN_A214]|uniref:class I SAM-dependent methyltransferase n=1 Tax=Arthrobacter sp. CAN_A214 TaxID=2787720 RepID=UPI0018CA32E7
MSGSLTADALRLTISDVTVSEGEPLSLLLGGRRIWTFRAPSEAAEQRRWSVEWPPALAERLTGQAALAVERDGMPLVGERLVAFDDGTSELHLTEPGTGMPQVVNKWGRVARSFEGRDAGLVEDVLDEAEHLIALLHNALSIDLFVTGGTLLGPVRNGRILANDDDADLAYLSVHDNPSDVALESFEVERTLRARGYEVVRHSSGHLQLMFPGGSMTDSFYLDIFSYFVCSGWFYGTFHARERAERVNILPLKRLPVNGRMLPGPAQPEQLLEAIYGPRWETPDPTFTFITPPAAFRRFYWWLNHFDVDRENWEDHHRAEIAAGPAESESELARKALKVFGTGSSILDLGCGLGADARFLARSARNVLAVDYSRPAIQYAGSQRETSTGFLQFEAVNLNMARSALHLRKQCAALDGAVNVYGNRLFDALSPLGWDTTLMLVKHLLHSSGSRGMFEVATDGPGESVRWNGCQLVGWDRFQEQLRRYGLVIEDEETVVSDEPQDAAGAGSTRKRVVVRKEKR